MPGSFDRLRLPCFWFGAHVGVLPAFGTFTGMHPIKPAKGERIFAADRRRVIELRPGLAPRSDSRGAAGPPAAPPPEWTPTMTVPPNPC